MKYGELSVGWRIEEERITHVSPCGYTLEVIARASNQTMSRAHRLMFAVRGHLRPAPDLEAAFDDIVEAHPSPLPTIVWTPVKPSRAPAEPRHLHDDRTYNEMRNGRSPDGCSGIMKG